MGFAPLVTPDGCPVEVYARLPLGDEADIVSRYCPPEGSVLDLGAGTGRVADALALQGFDVTAVDDSPAMLMHVREARSVCSRIEDLALDRRFDLVVLGSHLVNTADDELRRSLLTTAARHVKPTGQVLLQRHPPQWFDTLSPGRSQQGVLGPFGVVLSVLAMQDDVLKASVGYEERNKVWTQNFEARKLDGVTLNHCLKECGLSSAKAVAFHDDWVICDPEVVGQAE